MKNSFIHHASQEPQTDQSVGLQLPPAVANKPSSDKSNVASQPPSESSRRPSEHHVEGATSVVIKSPRQRVNSITQIPGHRPELSQSFSPLAQIYQPLVVDDDLIVEEAATETSAPSLPNPYSRRRRLSSMHRFPPTDPHISQSNSNVALRRFPTTTSSLGRTVPERTIMETPASVTLSQTAVPEAAQPPPLVANLRSLSQIEDEEDRTGATSQLALRLDRIEERQKSLESLLQEIAQRLRSAS